MYQQSKDPNGIFAYTFNESGNLRFTIFPFTAILIVLVYFIGTGLRWGYMDLLDGEPITLNHLLEGFRDRPLKLLGLGIRKYFITYLWSLLFVIPGIMKAYSYAMVTFLFRDYPEEDNASLLARSEWMMYGHRMELFVLDLLFSFLYVLIAGIVGMIVFAIFSSTAMEAIGGNVPLPLFLSVPTVALGVSFPPIYALLYMFIEPHR